MSMDLKHDSDQEGPSSLHAIKTKEEERASPTVQ